MVNGVSGQELPEGFPYKSIIEGLCGPRNFPPCLVGSIKMCETGLGQGPTTENDISGDGGHGIMQLTSSYPASENPDNNWTNPTTNIEYAIDNYLIPAMNDWKDQLQGDDLVRAIAATYNGGLGNAQAGHAEGDIGKYTTNHYDERCLGYYTKLIEGVIPQ